MNARSIISFLIGGAFLFTAEQGFSQNDQGRYVTLMTGIQKHTEVDRIISPFRYESNVFPVSLTITWNKSRVKQFVNAEYFSSNLTSLTGNSRSLDYIHLAYGYLRRIQIPGRWNEPLKIAGGWKWDTEFKLNKQHFSDLNTNLNASGYFASGLNLALNLSLSINGRHSLNYMTSVPMIQYIVRPGYSLFKPNEESDKIVDNLKEGSIEFINYGFRLNQQIEYLFWIGRNYYLTVSYRYNINKLPDPRPYGSTQKGITLGVRIKV